jgi:hypothetical protein
VSQSKGPLLHHQGKDRLGWLVHREIGTTVALSQVKQEDQVALAKLMEALRTNYNDRDYVYTITEEARSWAQNLWLTLTNWKRQKLKN